MNSSIQAVGATPFTSNLKVKKQRDNSGLKVGAGVFGACSTLSICSEYINKSLEAPSEIAKVLEGTKFSKMDKFMDMFKRVCNANLGKRLGIIAAMTLGCGLIVDYFNNKKREKAQPNAETENGNAYVKVNNGKKVGTLLGITIPTVASLAQIFILKELPSTSKAGTAGKLIARAATGFILGAITDKISNNKARKAADEKAEAFARLKAAEEEAKAAEEA